MKKFLSLIIMLFAFAAVSNAQCPSPTFSWTANKNSFTIPGRPFTSDSLLVTWQVGNTWSTKIGKLHAMSMDTRCKHANNCTYGIYFVPGLLYVSQIGYGIVSGAQVQIAIKCGGSWVYSNVETVNF